MTRREDTIIELRSESGEYSVQWIRGNAQVSLFRGRQPFPLTTEEARFLIDALTNFMEETFKRE